MSAMLYTYLLSYFSLSSVCVFYYYVFLFVINLDDDDDDNEWFNKL